MQREITSLFTEQVAAALQFEMEEVFAMTTEGIKGRLLMLQHAKSQGYAPDNADKLIMFLNLELKERAEGRLIKLEAIPPPSQQPDQPRPLPITSDPIKPLASSTRSASVNQAPAFSSKIPIQPKTSSGGAELKRARSSSESSNSRDGNAVGKESLQVKTSRGSQISRDRPWIPRPKPPPSQAFSLGGGGKVEVCFMTSGVSNRTKTKSKRQDEKEADARADKEKKQQEKQAKKLEKEQQEKQQLELHKEQKKKILQRIAEHKRKQVEKQNVSEETTKSNQKERLSVISSASFKSSIELHQSQTNDITSKQGRRVKNVLQAEKGARKNSDVNESRDCRDEVNRGLLDHPTSEDTTSGQEEFTFSAENDGNLLNVDNCGKEGNKKQESREAQKGGTGNCVERKKLLSNVFGSGSEATESESAQSTEEQDAPELYLTNQQQNENGEDEGWDEGDGDGGDEDEKEEQDEDEDGELVADAVSTAEMSSYTAEMRKRQTGSKQTEEGHTLAQEPEHALYEEAQHHQQQQQQQQQQYNRHEEAQEEQEVEERSDRYSDLEGLTFSSPSPPRRRDEREVEDAEDSVGEQRTSPEPWIQPAHARLDEDEKDFYDPSLRDQAEELATSSDGWQKNLNEETRRKLHELELIAFSDGLESDDDEAEPLGAAASNEIVQQSGTTETQSSSVGPQSQALDLEPPVTSQDPSREEEMTLSKETVCQKLPEVPATLYSSQFKSVEQIFTFHHLGEKENPQRFAEVAEKFIKEWESLKATFGRWRKNEVKINMGDKELDDALQACSDRASAYQKERSSAQLLFRVVQNRPEVASIVSEAFLSLRDDSADWTEMPASHKNSSCWNLLWTWSKPKIQWSDLNIWQRVNHFPEAKHLTRKDNLKRNVARYRNIPGKVGEYFDITPLTFTLPGEYVQFCTEFARKADLPTSKNLWIMKPAGSSRGRGIFVFNDIAAVSYTECVIVQAYIERPLLLEGYKFDLRLYVLVTSMNPLEAFLYQEGFARFSSERYSLDAGDIANRFIHLTNSSINRHNVNELQQRNLRSDGYASGGSKISLEQLQRRLRALGIDWKSLWGRVALVVLKTLFCVQDRIPQHPNAFELFGFDILIDSDLRPWLIEVNASPSLSRDNDLDFKVKDALVRDTLKVAAAPAFDREVMATMLKRRMTERSRGRWHVDKELSGDIAAILNGQRPREFGEMPEELGMYERIAPSKEWDEVKSVLKSRQSLK